MGILPTKGLTLPFLSYGGTSLVLCCTILGALLGISRRNSSKHVRPGLRRVSIDGIPGSTNLVLRGREAPGPCGSRNRLDLPDIQMVDLSRQTNRPTTPLAARSSA